MAVEFFAGGKAFVVFLPGEKALDWKIGLSGANDNFIFPEHVNPTFLQEMARELLRHYHVSPTHEEIIEMKKQIELAYKNYHHIE